MTTILIGYDLVGKDGMDYGKLEDAIKGLGGWWHCLDSTWLITIALTEVQVRGRLLNYIGANDRLLVLTPGRPAGAWYGMSDVCGDWLKRNLS
ncbi:SinR family protein [Burkholderia multivorans]|uniref:SinR family protein n=1 Tax=Burkholderia multivorans TaxID=87883 RepID=UPI000CFFF94D|nr:SinR family protein [Burkholderia multivorans]PRF40284.1 SinR family protein [Burkholderia multivorans]